jgi:DNA polymerase-3 subunit gamma/tau
VSLALYRRYRPATFAEVVGQEHVTEPLQQALRSDRVHHAYLFSGPRGCGKTSSARILARCLNCEQGPTPEPCGVCQSCVDLAPNGPGSIDVVEIDAASHGGVDDARDLREKAFFAPVASRFKVYIIDEAHMVSTSGFNALLKLVEEPPEHLKFVFATTEPEKVLQTIRSRTHHYPFRLVPPRALEGHLRSICGQEGVTVDDAALALVVRAGAGSVRDSLSVLDQLVSGSGDEGVTYRLAAALLGYSEESLLDEVVDAFAAYDGAAVFTTIDRVVDTGQDPRRFAEDLLERLRDLMIIDAVPDAGERGIVQAPADKLQRLALQAGRFGSGQLARAADVVNTGLTEMRGAVAPRLLLEIVCSRVLLPGVDDDVRGVHARLDRIERRIDVSGAVNEAVPAQARSAVRPPAGSAPDSPAATATAPTTAPPPAKSEQSVAPAEQPANDAAEPEVVVVLPKTPAPAPSRGVVDVIAIRQMWPDVVERVKTYKRVTWMLLMEQVQVASVDDRVLVLAFTNEGKRRGFAASGHDEIVRQALIDVLGLDRRIDAVLDPKAAEASPPVAAPVANGPESSPDEPAADEPMVKPAAAAPPDVPRAATPPPVSPDVSEVGEQDDDEVLDPGLSGAQLIQRELGGRVISESGPA